MKIILTKRNREEKMVDIEDVAVFTASDGCIVADFEGEEWFVKDTRPVSWASLKKLHDHANGAFVFFDRSKLVRRDQIVGRANYGMTGKTAAILKNGKVVEVARRRMTGFNRLIREMVAQ